MMDRYELAMTRMNDINRIPGEIAEYLRTEYEVGMTPGYLIAAAHGEDGLPTTSGPIYGFFQAMRRLFRRLGASDKRQTFWHHSQT